MSNSNALSGCFFLLRKFKFFGSNVGEQQNKTIRTEHKLILRNRLKKRSNTESYTDLVVSANPYAHVQQTEKDETDEVEEKE